MGFWCPSFTEYETERSVAARGEERTVVGQVEKKPVSAFHLRSAVIHPLVLSFILSHPSLFHCLYVLFYPPPALDLVLDWFCFNFFLFLSVSFSRPFSQLCCHGYSIISTWSASAEGSRIESNFAQQNTSSSAQASIDKHINCCSASKTATRGYLKKQDCTVSNYIILAV